MTSITPQATGNQLKSRNPFAALLSAQNTGTSNGSSSQANANASSPSIAGRTSPERTASKPSESDVNPPSPPPKRREGALNSPANATGATLSISRQGSSASNQATAPYRPPDGPPPTTPPRLPPRTPSTNVDASTDRARATASAPNQHRNSTLDLLNEDLPPAYTPGPNTREGEQSVEFGPVRPFMNAQSNQQQQRTRPRPVPQQGNLLGVSLSQSGHHRSRSSNRNGPSLSRLLGDILIDLATPREGERRPGNTSGPIGQSYPSSQPARTIQSLMSQASMRTTPPSSRGGGGGWSQYPGISRSVTPPPPQSLPLNDGRPTLRPTPGHPLISNGRVLIYPLGFECPKCHNRGFLPGHRSTFDDVPRALAPGDPSRLCKPCWRSYPRLYDGTVAQLDWTDTINNNFQRPISDASFMPSSTPAPSVPRSNNSRGPGNTALLQPRPTGTPARSPQRTPGGRTVVYDPGDPRIGGRICPRCRGEGSIRVFILETGRCPMCQGLGRVF